LQKVYFSKLCIIRQTITGLGLVEEFGGSEEEIAATWPHGTVVNNFAWNFL